jgi:small-conductance mechanosensitive channel
MTDNKNSMDLSLLISQHKQEIWEYKKRESEWIRTKNQLDGNKTIIEELSDKIISLTKEIERLAEENINVKTIEESHRKLNGDLRRDNKYLAKQVEDYREILRKAGL